MSNISKISLLVILILVSVSMVYAANPNQLTEALTSDLSISETNLNDEGPSNNTTQVNSRLTLPPLILVGEAELDVLWFDVYLAKLYSLDGTYQPESFPIKLAIQYHRDISAAELIEATIEQWQANGLTESQINRIKPHLALSWPDVNNNDTLSFIIHNDKQAEFLFNDKPFYQLDDAEFSAAFIGIWLSETTTEPKLRQQLIGAT
ncbi:chalcone isomerase family protein [Shewanella sp. OMA3-2]|uniref:chalcone isomerase family protein n=1 Tax=Shewanella sp. OMA3-2 TaxID=2908650 RepID=UPI001F3B626D|nr:chalcone isomerase family protein [Shewanella sp. OMA3-2]UJF21557.1 chalcone isomerase family protein [Shewanella sp. OMA3-2]